MLDLVRLKHDADCSSGRADSCSQSSGLTEACHQLLISAAQTELSGEGTHDPRQRAPLITGLSDPGHTLHQSFTDHTFRLRKCPKLLLSGVVGGLQK